MRPDQLQSIVASRHSAANQLLDRSRPAYSIPVADSRMTSPGYIFLGDVFHTYQDALRPWDPAVIEAIREFEPTAMPFTVRSHWQRVNYGDIEPEFTLVRHGMARVVRDARIPIHQFRCELPVHDEPMTYTTPHVYGWRPANYIEFVWYDRDDRPYGFDLPGAFLPIDWEFYHNARRTYENNRRPKDIAEEMLEPARDQKARADAFQIEEDAYKNKILREDCGDQVADRVWEEIHLGKSQKRRTESEAELVPA